jgi:hypothetical protein
MKLEQIKEKLDELEQGAKALLDSVSKSQDNRFIENDVEQIVFSIFHAKSMIDHEMLCDQVVPPDTSQWRGIARAFRSLR